jgi:hypothetical protein
MTNATMTADQMSMADLRKFIAENEIVVEGNRRFKATLVSAVAAYQQSQLAASVAQSIETVKEVSEASSIAVEPTALTVESAVVATAKILTSDTAIGIYRGSLRLALQVGYLALMALTFAGVWAWRRLEGGPAVVCWVRAYANETPRGRLMRRAVGRQWRTVRTELGLVGAPLVAKAREVRAIVRVGGQRVFGGGVISD